MKGSQGQPVLNPALRAVTAFDTSILALEDRLGLTPRARLQLGIQLNEAVRSLAELNRTLQEEEDGTDADPRADVRAINLPVD